ncbi:Npun_F0494 family protein [Pleurocapsa sp. PCC 7319]|uniref:Npun_F0494 family protein n=1 Tax=Pleurocapsa sp. PCC 7319 TaxID=118161 RepID=UPI00034A0F1E|nr:Npun_F0494 family protein [Pleurocapsa sp. PCC 7319]
MTTNFSNQAIEYDPRTIKRAKRALSCSPFCLKLFQEMRNQSVPIQQIAGATGLKLGYATLALSEPKTEDKLVWLINVGLLRREVDGQGLTDSFRLTPLGRNIVAEWEQEREEIPPASLIDRIYNRLNHWL